MSLSYRNQSIDLQRKSMDRFLSDRDLRHERVNTLKIVLVFDLMMFLTLALSVISLVVL